MLHLFGQHGVQPGQPLHALWDPPTGQQPPLIDQHWPWARHLAAAFARLSALPIPAG